MNKEVKASQPTDASTVVEDTQKQLYKLLRSFESCDQQCLSRYGVTASQGYALLAFPFDSSTSMNELSRAMGLANSTMTRMVESLVAKGLAYRLPDENDRRVVRVMLTTQGEQLRRSLEEARRELQQRIFDGIQEEERLDILRSLKSLNRAIEKTLRSCCGD